MIETPAKNDDTNRQVTFGGHISDYDIKGAKEDKAS